MCSGICLFLLTIDPQNAYSYNVSCECKCRRVLLAIVKVLFSNKSFIVHIWSPTSSITFVPSTHSYMVCILIKIISLFINYPPLPLKIILVSEMTAVWHDGHLVWANQIKAYHHLTLSLFERYTTPHRNHTGNITLRSHHQTTQNPGPREPWFWSFNRPVNRIQRLDEKALSII